jgi:hypothetical protein
MCSPFSAGQSVYASAPESIESALSDSISRGMGLGVVALRRKAGFYITIDWEGIIEVFHPVSEQFAKRPVGRILQPTAARLLIREHAAAAWVAYLLWIILNLCPLSLYAADLYTNMGL